MIELRNDPLTFEQIVERIQGRFPDVSSDIVFGELTIFTDADTISDLLRFCRDDDELSCEMLSDLGGVHWPAGDHVIDRQASTTGWPEHRVSRERGVVEVNYVVRSLSRNHLFRIVVGVDDEAGTIPTATTIYPTADFPEREVYDMFGVEFEGHPNMVRILMPDDWLGHPLRKDYPLGGVDVDYKNGKFIPPPHERDLREVIE